MNLLRTLLRPAHAQPPLDPVVGLSAPDTIQAHAVDCQLAGHALHSGKEWERGLRNFLQATQGWRSCAGTCAMWNGKSENKTATCSRPPLVSPPSDPLASADPRADFTPTCSPESASRGIAHGMHGSFRYPRP